MVFGRIRADDDNHLGLGHVLDLIGDCGRANAFEQGGHRRGVAQARAVIDIIGAKAGPDQLLKQIRLLVAALGRAKAGQSLTAVLVTDLFQAGGSQIEGFVPVGLTEDVPPAVRVKADLGRLGYAGLADQGLCQTLGVVHIVEAKAAFDAQPARDWPVRRGR